jgi:predicted amidohydrolase
LIVLPAFSFTGCPGTREQAHSLSEVALGRTTQVLSDFATRTQRHVVGSHVERDGDALFHTVLLLSPQGIVGGTYRQTHLDPEFAAWCTAGDDLRVFETSIGRIGLLSCEDVRFPEASGVLAVRRTDLIAIPTRWMGEYGGNLHDAVGLFESKYPANTMCMWYAIAKTAQAYTVVANSIDQHCQGSSGVFTIDPVDSTEVPKTAGVDQPGFVTASVSTLGSPQWWMNQDRLIGGRRADLAVPAMLDSNSAAFKRWKESPGYDINAWSEYSQ